MTYTLLSYLIYLSVSILLTIFAGRVLFKNGRPFLLDIFKGNEKLADSINRLLLMGFYMLNIGYISLTMYNPLDILSVEHLVENLSSKIGVILLILGMSHLVNLFVLFRVRRKYVGELAA